MKSLLSPPHSLKSPWPKLSPSLLRAIKLTLSQNNPEMTPLLEEILRRLVLRPEKLVERGRASDFWREPYRKFVGEEEARHPLKDADKKALNQVVRLVEFLLSILYEASHACLEDGDPWGQAFSRTIYVHLVYPSLVFFGRTLGPESVFASAKNYNLSRREIQVAALRERMTVKEIANELGISVHTTRGCVKRILNKTRSHSTGQALRKLRGAPPLEPYELEPIASLVFLNSVKGIIEKMDPNKNESLEKIATLSTEIEKLKRVAGRWGQI